MKFLGYQDLAGRLYDTWKGATKRRGSKYGPHQAKRERLRRLRQIDEGKLEMAGTSEIRDTILQARLTKSGIVTAA